MARLGRSVVTCISGCHCTPKAQPGASATRTASIVPSGAVASTTSPAPGRSMACSCSEFTVISASPTRAASSPQSVTGCFSRNRWLHLPLARPMIRAARKLLQFLVQRAAKGHVQLLQPTADRQHRHAARHRGADQGQGGVVAGRVVQVGRQILGHAVAMRLHVAGAAGEQQPVQPVQNRERRLAQRRQQHRHRARLGQHRRCHKARVSRNAAARANVMLQAGTPTTRDG